MTEKPAVEGLSAALGDTSLPNAIPMASISQADLQKLNDTIAGMRGTAEQTRVERTQMQTQLAAAASEGTDLRAQVTQLAAQMQQVSAALPSLQEWAQRGQRLDAMTEHPEILRVASLKELFLTVDMSQEQLKDMLGKVSADIQALMVPLAPAVSVPPAATAAPAAATPGGDSGEQIPKIQPAPVTPGAPISQATPPTSQPPAPGTPAATGEAGAGTQAVPLPKGPPPVNTPFIDNPLTSLNTRMDAAIATGNMDIVSDLLMKEVLPNIPDLPDIGPPPR